MENEGLAASPIHKKYDVVIVGAGPGGCTAALSLAKSSLRVAILDKAEFPRDKICGDALSGKVVSVLKYTAPEVEAALHAFAPKLGSWGIRFFAPNGEALDLPFVSEHHRQLGQAPGYITKRLDFDQFLLEEVKTKNRCDIYEGEGAEQIERTETGIQIQTGKHTFEAQLVIGADGAHSLVNKQLGNIRMEPDFYSGGLRSYYRGVTGFHEENFIELHYIKDLLPGYFWIFPLADGWANVGLGMLSKDISRGKVNLKKQMQRIIETHPTIAPRFAQAEQVTPMQGFGLPLGGKKRQLSGDRFMLVGDAASLIDPMTGEGIGNAMLSGKIAGEVAIKSLEQQQFDGVFLQQYDEAVWRKTWQELRLSHQLQKLLNQAWLFNFAVRKANRNASLQTMLSMMFNDLDMRAELRKPSFYWRLIWG